MSANEKLIGIYTGPGLAVPASNLVRIPTVDGTISDATVDLTANADGDTSFNLLLDGVLVTAITIPNGSPKHKVTGLSQAIALGSILSLDLIAPFPTSLPDPPISLVITYDDGVSAGGTVTHTGGALTSNAVVLGAGTDDTKVVTGIVTDGTSKVTLGVAGSSVGAVAFKNATSGTVTVQPVTGALGTVTLSLPAATDTLVGKATTDTLTNKTLTSPTLTAPVLGTPASGNLSNCTNVPAAQISGVIPIANLATGTPNGAKFVRDDGTLATPAGSGTVTASGGSLTSNALVLGAGTTDTKVASGLTTDGTSKITVGVAGSSVGSVDFKNATSGTVTLSPVTGALGSVTLSLPAATDTLVGKATADTLTNKTLTSPTLTTPVLGTPSSGTLTSCTGLPISTGVSGLGTSVATRLADAADGSVETAIGYRGIPQNSQSTDYTCVMADNGKHIYQTGASKTVTIPANGSVAYPIGAAITIIATNATGCTIAITTDTMTLAGSTTTGSRTLSQNGVATAIKVTSTTWIISGMGLT